MQRAVSAPQPRKQRHPDAAIAALKQLRAVAASDLRDETAADAVLRACRAALDTLPRRDGSRHDITLLLHVTGAVAAARRRRRRSSPRSPPRRRARRRA